MSAVLRVSGERGLLHHVLEASELAFTESGQSRRQRRLSSDGNELLTTYNLTISEAQGNCVPVQITSVSEFLDLNAERINELLDQLPDCRFTIDFAWDIATTSVAPFNSFPAELLSRLGTLGVDLVVSVYLVDGPIE